MIARRILVICVLAVSGCAPGAGSNNKTSDNVQSNAEWEAAQAFARAYRDSKMESLPPRITNQFGMTFRLVTIDTTRPDHHESFPKRSYYIQETELASEQHSAFRKAAFGDGKYEGIDWHFNGGFPSEWREVSRYAQALSKFDQQYDYKLPSRAEWVFACKSGYEQRCDPDKPNAFGMVGMLDGYGNAEAAEDIIVRSGHEFGLLMGYWKDNWGEHRGEEKPDCPCEYWTVCNPDADDSLNELIVCRLVLLPVQIVHNPYR